MPRLARRQMPDALTHRTSDRGVAASTAGRTAYGAGVVRLAITRLVRITVRECAPGESPQQTEKDNEQRDQTASMREGS